MPRLLDHTEIAPEARFEEVATLLAEGLLRLKIQACLDSENSLPEGLEVSSDTVLSVIHTGLLPRPFGDPA